MHKAKQNFAYAGKTYFVGDEVPQTVASTLSTDLVSKPSTKKTETYDTSNEGEY